MQCPKISVRNFVSANLTPEGFRFSMVSFSFFASFISFLNIKKKKKSEKEEHPHSIGVKVVNYRVTLLGISMHPTEQQVQVIEIKNNPFNILLIT